MAGDADAGTALEAAKEQVVTLLRSAQDAKLPDEIHNALDMPLDKVREVIQALLNEGEVQLRKAAGSDLMRFSLSTEAEAAENNKTRGLSAVELLVYQKIQQAGNKGIWTRDLRISANMLMTKLQKALKTLEGRGIVKPVKSAGSGTKRIYMLTELSPSDELTGGQWFNNGALDVQLIEMVRKMCFRIIERHGEVKLSTLMAEVAAKGFQHLSQTSIQEVLSTLALDGQIDEGVNDDEASFSTVAMAIPDSSPLNEVPCGQCPVIHECADGNDISPATCEYMQAWLQF